MKTIIALMMLALMGGCAAKTPPQSAANAPKQCYNDSDCAKGYTCRQYQHYAWGASDAPKIIVSQACLPTAPPHK